MPGGAGCSGCCSRHLGGPCSVHSEGEAQSITSPLSHPHHTWLLTDCHSPVDGELRALKCLGRGTCLLLGPTGKGMNRS